MTAPGSGPGSPGGYGQQPGGSQPGGYGQQPPSQPGGPPGGGGYGQQPPPGYGQPPGGQPGGPPPGYGGPPPPSYGSGAPGQYPGQGPNRGGGSSFDMKSIGTAEWLILGGALLYFIVSFLPWLSISSDICDGLPEELATGCDVASSVSAWTANGLLGFAAILLLIAAAGVIAKAMNLIPRNVPLHLITAGIGLVAVIFFLIGFLDILTADDAFGVSVGPAFGTWLGLLAILLFIAGVAMSFLASGGKKDLQEGLNKLQQNAAQGGPPPGYGQQGQHPGQPGQPGPGQQPGGYGQQPGQPSQPPQGGYGQPGSGAPQTPGGYGQPGQSTQSGYGQSGTSSGQSGSAGSSGGYGESGSSGSSGGYGQSGSSTGSSGESGSSESSGSSGSSGYGQSTSSGSSYPSPESETGSGQAPPPPYGSNPPASGTSGGWSQPTV